jgi:hypothetical protein
MNHETNPTKFADLYSQHIFEAYTDLFKCASEIGCMPTIDRSNGMEAAEFTLTGPFGLDGHYVRVSNTVYPEETTVMVFIKEIPGKPDQTLTRHYQPIQYFGHGENGRPNSNVYASNVTRRPIDWVGLDALAFLKDGKFPTKEFDPSLFKTEDFAEA